MLKDDVNQLVEFFVNYVYRKYCKIFSVVRYLNFINSFLYLYLDICYFDRLFVCEIFG